MIHYWVKTSNNTSLVTTCVNLLSLVLLSVKIFHGITVIRSSYITSELPSNIPTSAAKYLIFLRNEYYPKNLFSFTLLPIFKISNFSVN